MKTHIPNTDIDVYPLCLGTDVFGSYVSEADSFALMDAYTAQNGNFLDSAHVYGGGASETTIGRWLRARENRNQIVIGTKGAHFDVHTGEKRLAPENILSDLHESLTRLGVDAIDLYYLHRDDEERPVEAIIDVLEGLVQSGKIRYYGLSNWKTHRLRAAAAYGSHLAACQNRWSFAAISPHAGLPGDMVCMDAEAHAFHAESGLAQVPYSSQGKGYFSKRAQGAVIHADVLRTYECAENDARYAALQRLAAKTGAGMEALALAFLLRQPFAVVPVIGPKRMEHLAPSLAAAPLGLEAADMQEMLDFEY